MTPTLAVLAKAPVPGRAKTRLCPPFDQQGSAMLAAAALADTLAAVAATPGARRLLVLDGDTGDWLPPGFEVVPQRPGNLGARLAGAFEAADGPAVVLGMDTPQVTPTCLAQALGRLADPDVDAVIGPATDGGYWAIGLSEPDARVFCGVPMSTSITGARQVERLCSLGQRVRALTTMRDVDVYDDAVAVASIAPGTRFASVFRRLDVHEPVAR
jgi:uncharacterized protein